MNKVRHLLKNKGEQVWKVSIDATVLDCLELMKEKGTGSLLVFEGENVVGIFTERDYARKVGADGRKPQEVLVATVMTRDLITVHLDQTVNECMVLMTNEHIRHLPVMDQGRLVGVVSIGDVVKDVIEELEFHVEQLKSYITGFR